MIVLAVRSIRRSLEPRSTVNVNTQELYCDIMSMDCDIKNSAVLNILDVENSS